MPSQEGKNFMPFLKVKITELSQYFIKVNNMKFPFTVILPSGS
jgi:hypothetical protein